MLATIGNDINSYKVCQTGAECDGHGGLASSNKLYDEILLLIQMYV